MGVNADARAPASTVDEGAGSLYTHLANIFDEPSLCSLIVFEIDAETCPNERPKTVVGINVGADPRTHSEISRDRGVAELRRGRDLPACALTASSAAHRAALFILEPNERPAVPSPASV